MKMQNNVRIGLVAAAVVGVCLLSFSGGSKAMNTSTQNVKHITAPEFPAEVEQSGVPVVADFYATWCGPCRELSPMLDKLATTYTNRIKFVKINVDESPSLAQRFSVEGIPMLIFFKDGKVVDSLVGLQSPDTLKDHLNALAVMTGHASAPAEPAGSPLNGPNPAM
jgi:thioredoxin 1